MSDTTQTSAAGLFANTSREAIDAVTALLLLENPDGVSLVDARGRLIAMNDVAVKLTGYTEDANPETWSADYGMYYEDMVTPYQPHDLPIVKALAGETINEALVFRRVPGTGQTMWLGIQARPLPGGGAICIFRDVSERKMLSEELARRARELADREQENRELIARLRVAVDELSTPVLEIWDDVLALPVVGIVDTQRSAQMTERLLAEVVRTRSRAVIVDLTGVDIVDTSTADRFIKLARAVQLLGARCLVTGIQPAVAQTLVELGIEFTALETHRNLKSALETCIRRDVAERKAMSR